MERKHIFNPTIIILVLVIIFISALEFTGNSITSTTQGNPSLLDNIIFSITNTRVADTTIQSATDISNDGGGGAITDGLSGDPIDLCWGNNPETGEHNCLQNPNHDKKCNEYGTSGGAGGYCKVSRTEENGDVHCRCWVQTGPGVDDGYYVGDEGGGGAIVQGGGGAIIDGGDLPETEGDLEPLAPEVPDEEDSEDEEETRSGDEPSAHDTDGDGLIDSEEILWRTDPTNPDSDFDGYSDGEEIGSCTNPLNGISNIEALNNVCYDDIDQGEDEFVKGCVYMNQNPRHREEDVCMDIDNAENYIEVDSCTGENCHVNENFCEGGDDWVTSKLFCRDGCKNGECLIIVEEETGDMYNDGITGEEGTDDTSKVDIIKEVTNFFTNLFKNMFG